MSRSLTPQKTALPLQIIDTSQRNVKVLSTSLVFVPQEISMGALLMD